MRAQPYLNRSNKVASSIEQKPVRGQLQVRQGKSHQVVPDSESLPLLHCL